MISHEKKCIFVHIPKTGGTSVENLIWGSNWEARSTDQLWMGVVRPGFNKYQSGGLQHLLAKQILAEVGESTFESYFKFSFVRNPWDKAVSQFNYIKTRPMLLKHMGMNRFSSFGKYLKIISGNHSMHVQSFEQWRFILDENGKQIVDFVGRFEKLQEDFDIVARKIGLASSQLPHDMKSTGRMPYQVYYKSGMAEMISQTYAKDIEMFGYAFN